jgi:hypothetical protein
MLQVIGWLCNAIFWMSLPRIWNSFVPNTASATSGESLMNAKTERHAFLKTDSGLDFWRVVENPARYQPIEAREHDRRSACEAKRAPNTDPHGLSPPEHGNVGMETCQTDRRLNAKSSFTLFFK